MEVTPDREGAPGAPPGSVLCESNLRALQRLRPNVAVLPWGATEAHNFHLPFGTDVIEADGVGRAAVAAANRAGARCVLLPCVPFGVNHGQLYQTATISMRSATQHAVLRDVAESLVSQDIDRMVVFNFHGGNEFRAIIRDIMFDLPIFIVQVHGYQMAPQMRALLDVPDGDHADEFETSLMLHLAPEHVAPLDTAGDGAARPSALPALTATPGVWLSRDWRTLSSDTGVGDPRGGTAEKGRRIFEMLVAAFVPVLVELSGAREGTFPFILRKRS